MIGPRPVGIAKHPLLNFSVCFHTLFGFQEILLTCHLACCNTHYGPQTHLGKVCTLCLVGRICDAYQAFFDYKLWKSVHTLFGRENL